MQAWKTESVKLCASAGRGRSGQVESREEEEVECGGGGGDDEYLPVTDTSHMEVALGLLLLSLPNSFGASRHELFLFDDSEVVARLRDKDDAAVVAHASKIAELLKATDISYL